MVQNTLFKISLTYPWIKREVVQITSLVAAFVSIIKSIHLLKMFAYNYSVRKRLVNLPDKFQSCHEHIPCNYTAVHSTPDRYR